MWLSVVNALVKLAHGVVGWLDRRRLMQAGEARAAREALSETLEIVSYAKRVDRDTANLSRDARERLRRAIRRDLGSDE